MAQSLCVYNTTSTAPRNTQQGAASRSIQPSQSASNTTPLATDIRPDDSSRPRQAQPTNPRTTRQDVVDNQGNPIDANGNLIVETVASIDEITDQDFETPTRTIALPTLPDNVSNAIGTNGRQVIIKKNIFEKNGSTHVELDPSDSREILQSALYNTNIVGTTQPIKRPDYKVAIRTGEKNAVVVLDVFQGKEYVEIVGWRKVNEKGLEKMQRQAEREGGQFLILSPNKGAAAALSALPSGASSNDKDTTNPQTSNNLQQKIAQSYTITPAKYTTKRGKVLDMHLVKFAGTLTKEQQRAAKEFAKAEKGWYDREQGGFMMRSEESAKQLADTILNNDDAVSDAQPVSMTDIQALNNGDVLFTEPQQPKEQPKDEEYHPIWQYSIHVDADGYTTISRDDVSSGYPIGDASFRYSTDSPEEMLDILRNPHNGMQDVLEAVGVTLENKIKTRELDRKIAEQRKQEYEALRANGVNGYKIGEKVIYKGKEATIYDFEEFGAHQPVLDTGMAPVIYEVAEWSKIKKPQQNQSASSPTGQDLTTGYSTDNDAETSAKIHISKQGAKYELNKLIHKYVGQRKTRGFISDLAKALGNKDNTPRQTYYFEFADKQGNPYTLRISNHNVNGENIADNEKEISIVIKHRRKTNKFIAANADVIEYVYFKESIANGDGQTLAWIIQDIVTMLDTGVYADNSGMAVINTTPQSETRTIQTTTNQGQFNLVSDDRMAELKDRLRKKLGGQNTSPRTSNPNTVTSLPDATHKTYATPSSTPYTQALHHDVAPTTT